MLMDIPGLGETTLAKAISQCIAVDFSRIQFTLDLLPSDSPARASTTHGSRVFSGSRSRSPGARRTPRRRTSKGREQGQGLWSAEPSRKGGVARI